MTTAKRNGTRIGGILAQQLAATATKKIYQANCIEAGERFTTHFTTSETSPSKLRKFGEDMASEWGGECISVHEWKPATFIKIKDTKTGKIIATTEKKWDNYNKSAITIKDHKTGKVISTTERKLNAWIERHGQEKIRYTIIGRGSDRYTEVERGQEPAPKDLWDCDKSHEENMKDYDVATGTRGTQAAAPQGESTRKTDSGITTKAELMEKAKAAGIKYYRILTKAELFSALDHPGDRASIIEKAKARWESGQTK